MLCSQCQHSLDDGMHFCPNCGRAIKPKVPFPKKRISLIGFGVLLIGLLFLCGSFSGPNLTAPIEGHLKAIRNNHITQAYYQYMSSRFQASMPLIAFRKLVQAHSALKQNKNFSVEDTHLMDGTAVLSGLLTSQDNDFLAVEYKLTRENNEWKIEAIALETPSKTSGATSATSTTPTEPADWLGPIDEQLRALRNQDIQAAYESTSAEFKGATTLQDFAQFVNTYPILGLHKDLTVKAHQIKGNKAEIMVILNPEHEAIPVQYLLIQEDGKWKIWAMDVISGKVLASPMLKDPKAMREPVEKQLQALREQDIPRAYHDFTSKAFQQATSLESFTQFLNSFPVLIHYDAAEFGQPVLDKETGKLEVNLFNKDGTTTLAYTLGVEDNQWKIWGLQVAKQPSSLMQSSSPSLSLPQQLSHPEPKLESPVRREAGQLQMSPEPAVEIDRILVGSKSAENGRVLDPSYSLQSPNTNIYVNISLHNGVAGMKVETRLEHEESHAMIPPISTTLQQNGDSIISFAFAPPSGGWPDGHYRIHAVTSTGVSQTQLFEMRSGTTNPMPAN